MELEAVLKKILDRFNDDYQENGRIRALERIISEGADQYKYAEEMAREVGKILNGALRTYLPEALTNGMLYRKAAEVVLKQPMLKAVKPVSDAASSVQKNINAQAGIGINPIIPEVNEDQVNGIITGICNAESYESGKETLFDQVENFLEGHVDDSVHDNAGFQYEAGLDPTVTRTAAAKCCKWCDHLAGTYEYEKVRNKGNDVWRRHKNCHCIIDYNPGKISSGAKIRQNVNKRWTEKEDRAIIEKRKRLDQLTEVSERPVAHKMANGPRCAPKRHVSEAEELRIRKDADDLKIPQDVLKFNTGIQTSFDDDHGWINIRGDIFPADYAQNPESILNERCALAHEYYGHMKHSPSRFDIGDWRDEFEASYSAAINTPNLTDDERRMLMIDAFDRAKDAGVPVKMNEKARRIIYGYD